MNRFLQLHYLTAYPPSNPNRDDTGRPKTAVYGGVPRLRISSQSLKRAVRVSDVMRDSLRGHLGERTRRIGDVVRDALVAEGATAEQGTKVAKDVAVVFGKLDAKGAAAGHVRTRTLAFVSPDERQAAIRMARGALAGKQLPKGKDLRRLILRTADGAADVAMFGRMLAEGPEFNREAAVQVSHAITTHQARSEDDYFTAVDDLSAPAEEVGAGFVGDAGFGSGVFYTYVCVDCGLLLENLAGDREIAGRAVSALVEGFATATPSGKRSSFAHQTRAGYIRAEVGAAQPRSLAGAFFRAVTGRDLMAASAGALEDLAARMDAAYGPCADAIETMDVAAGAGTLSAVQEFASAAARHA